jgi:hypothetical protein
MDDALAFIPHADTSLLHAWTLAVGPILYRFEHLDKLFRSALAAPDVRLTGLAVHSRHLTPCSAGFCVGRAGVTYPERPIRALLAPLMDAHGRGSGPLDV